MKILLSTLLICLVFGSSKGQETYPVTERIPVLDGNRNPIPYGVSRPESNIMLLLKADQQTKSIRPFNQIPNDPLGSIVFLEGTREVQVTTHINADSLSFYRYSIIENDKKIIVRNGRLSTLVDGSPGFLVMDLRIPEVTGKKITVKIYRLPEADKITTLVIYNKPFERVRVLKKELIDEEASGINKQDEAMFPGMGPSIRINKKTKGIMLSVQKTDLDFAYQVYVFNKKNKTDYKYSYVPLNNWDYNTQDGNPRIFIDKNYFSAIGDYEIKIIPAPYLAGYRYGLEPGAYVFNSRGQVSFHVSSVPGVFSLQETGIIALITLITVTCAALLIIGFSRKRALKKIVLAQFKTEAAKGELDQIRARLNPHFVYNSLSSIQNLMNQKETEKANAYLSKFARLTRNILNDQEMISILEEQRLLGDYLSMESLRFKFSYEVNITGDNNFPNTEIPAMLLQPFVENAVKHNMATLQDEGKLLIGLTADQKNVILSVKDNGPGFDTEKTYDGLGLKLCRKRIQLLNQLYKECPVSLHIESGSEGTTVTIILENWL